MLRKSDPEAFPVIAEPTLAEQMDGPAVDDRIIGRSVGPYQIIAEIGRGGMGTVYRAVRADGEFEVAVAIKVVRHGMNSGLVLERFRIERQIQARLGHPNITRLLDGGTTDDGLTYFVMEYIQGYPLTKYCDSRQLSITDRLKLFRKICDAVSYAHQNLIVHRDLKPDNILVTAEGTPKLLDFGLAKILEVPADGSEPTMTMVRMGTPAYSSPEQILGEPVGIATDVYSLGVVLYELLTGRRPYRLESLGWEESARVVCERDATRPSSVVSRKAGNADETEQISLARRTTIDGLRKRLAGDLDNIVSVALRKEPARRYRSVDQLNEEIQNHLEGRPVKARGDSIAYKAGKLIGRHKLGFAMVAAFSIMLIAASGVAVWQARRLAVRVDEDRKLATSFLVNMHEVITKLPGSTPVREALLKKSMEYLNRLASDTGNDRETRRSLALAYERFADLQVGVDAAGFGKSAQALGTYETAKRLREALAREDPQDTAAQRELASNYLLGSYITGRASTLEQRTAYDRKALAISEKLASAQPGNRGDQALLAKAYTSVAYGYGMSARWQEATAYYRKALPIREQLAADSPNNTSAQRDLANLYYRMGVMETQSGRPAAALPDLSSALATQTRILRTDKYDEQLRSDTASTRHFLGMALGATGDLPQALAQFREAIAIREKTLAADGRDARTRSLLAGNYAEYAAILLKSGQKDAALATLLRALSLQRELLALDSHGVPVRLSLADYEARLAALYAATGRERDAVQNWQRAKAVYDELDREGHLEASDVRSDAEKVRAEARRHGVR
jgi:non-specific serine/threonine protein kinase/serine/threonine-protein kinase